MAFKLENGEAAASGIRRIANECLDEALNQFEDSNIEPDIAIHEARKLCKRLRAVVRLVRNNDNEEWYARENVRFRDASRLLAPARDAAVLVETLDNLLEHSRSEDTDSLLKEQLSDVSFEELRSYLVERHRRVAENIVNHSAAIDQFIAEMRDARRRMLKWPIEENEFETFYPGLKRVYRRGLTEMKGAYSEPTTENLHEWRKQVKYLWHQVEILEPVWPGLMQPLAESIHTISDHLGDDHDIAELHYHLEVDEQAVLSREQSALLQKIVVARRGALQNAARPVGERVYAESPKRFAKRIEQYWNAWRAHCAVVV